MQQPGQSSRSSVAVKYSNFSMRTAKAVCNRNGYRQLLHYGALGMLLGYSDFCSSTVGIDGDIDAGVVRSFGAEWHTL